MKLYGPQHISLSVCHLILLIAAFAQVINFLAIMGLNFYLCLPLFFFKSSSLLLMCYHRRHALWLIMKTVINKIKDVI